MTRAKGEDTTLTLVTADGAEESFGDVKSLDITFERDISSEGYLGQKTEQKDHIFKGVTGKGAIHVSSVKALDTVARINRVTQNRQPGESFEIATTIGFDDGKRRIVLPDAKFGTIGVSAGSRADFIEISFDFAANDGRILPA